MYGSSAVSLGEIGLEEMRAEPYFLWGDIVGVAGRYVNVGAVVI